MVSLLQTGRKPVVVRFCGVLEETLSSHWILAFAKTPNAKCIIARSDITELKN